MIPLFKTEHNIDFDYVNKKIFKLREYDDIVTAPMFGYANVVDYYTNCNTVPLLKEIKTKSLFISAMDDPFFGPDIIPYDEFEKNENIYIMATRGGGHVGYIESIFDSNQWYIKPICKFFNHLNDLQTGKEISFAKNNENIISIQLEEGLL